MGAFLNTTEVTIYDFYIILAPPPVSDPRPGRRLSPPPVQATAGHHSRGWGGHGAGGGAGGTGQTVNMADQSECTSLIGWISQSCIVQTN